MRRFFHDQDGQGLAEYGMILMLVAILCVATASHIGDQAIRLAGSANTTLESISS